MNKQAHFAPFIFFSFVELLIWSQRFVCAGDNLAAYFVLQRHQFRSHPHYNCNYVSRAEYKIKYFEIENNVSHAWAFLGIGSVTLPGMAHNDECLPQGRHPTLMLCQRWSWQWSQPERSRKILEEAVCAWSLELRPHFSTDCKHTGDKQQVWGLHGKNILGIINETLSSYLTGCGG
ncbi:unnamed protein product [Lepidochelys kempii]